MGLRMDLRTSCPLTTQRGHALHANDGRFQRRTAMIQRGKARPIRERWLKDWGRRMSPFRAGCGLLA
jgi:hypothetical protein